MKKQAALLLFFFLIYKTSLGQADTLSNRESYKSLLKITDKIMSDFKENNLKNIIQTKRKLGENQDKAEIKSLVDEVNLKIKEFGLPSEKNTIAILSKYNVLINEETIDRWFIDIIYSFDHPCNSGEPDKMIFTFALGEIPEINSETKLQSFLFLSCQQTTIPPFDGQMFNDSIK